MVEGPCGAWVGSRIYGGGPRCVRPRCAPAPLPLPAPPFNPTLHSPSELLTHQVVVLQFRQVVGREGLLAEYRAGRRQGRPVRAVLGPPARVGHPAGEEDHNVFLRGEREADVREGGGAAGSQHDLVCP